jgi:hypothetical protein
MRLYLNAMKAWYLIDKKVDVVKAKDEDERALIYRASSILYASVPDTLCYILGVDQSDPDSESPYRLWGSIRHHFCPPTRKTHLKAKVAFFRVTMEPGEDPSRFIHRVRAAFNVVVEAGVDINAKSQLTEEDIIAVIMEGIQQFHPDAYNVLNLSQKLSLPDLEAYVRNNCKTDTERLETLNGIGQSTRKSYPRSDERQQHKSAGKQEEKPKRCGHCHKPGHFAKECPKRKESNQNRRSETKPSSESSDDKTYKIFAAMETFPPNISPKIIGPINRLADVDDMDHLNGISQIPSIVLDSGCSKHVIGTPHHQFISQW